MTTEMAIAVRATGERTCNALLEQIKHQCATNDVVEVFDDAQPFYEKMQQVYRWCIAQDKPITLIIDADILIRRRLLHTIRQAFRKMHPTDAGFGIQLFDRFFQRPKFRGIHVYNTALLPLFMAELPRVKDSLRPETDVKKRLEALGYQWKNDLLTFYVGGLHDYHQWYRDIYFKMMVRSHRSPDLVAINYIPDDGSAEYAFVKRGLKDGARQQTLVLDKRRYVIDDIAERAPLTLSIDVDGVLKKELRRHYGRSLWYLASLYVWAEPLLVWRLGKDRVS